ncbi:MULTISPECIES: GNAT family N-acetyltransferase [unclassified Streptomyces]|uniref:GNAT family N-acetyltransferase n=1 Tax=unclassified Streptomyces TaxID=2593676 RepID=UPI000F70C81F|nr:MULTISPECIES: GNAT family N-acetyltransferase [unclassified Streptomyces]AZM63191.1 N-acetyltransferase [Streptomyces sp. WAC 01438]RSN00638.1 N-acetyltransferase [Streptomyces sp. WAC 01420]
MKDLPVRAATAADRAAIVDLLSASWGGTTVVGHGTVYDAAELPALVVERDGTLGGLLTYMLSGDGLEVVTVDAVVRHAGIGSALLAAAAETARGAGARRLWLVTTNDNLDALRFYQRRGLRIVGVARGAVDAARRLKPSIPETGQYGIPLHDELTLELRL